jgi:hypothetical protein
MRLPDPSAATASAIAQCRTSSSAASPTAHAWYVVSSSSSGSSLRPRRRWSIARLTAIRLS